VLLVVVVGGVIALLEGPRIGWGSATAQAGYLGVVAAAAGFVWAEDIVGK
jgi:hypothetical protein